MGAMSYIDLQPVLVDWRYDADRISTRKIIGADGRPKIQMRVELGLLQMEIDGRPDGEKPCGCDSLLAYYHKKLAEYQARNATTLGFGLTPRECRALSDEVSLYYQRYVALFVLEEFALMVRDTSHNLAILDLCSDYALEAKDRIRMEPTRAYVLMMDARARALEALLEDQVSSSVAHVNRGILSIRDHFEQWGRPDAFESSEEVKVLRELRGDLLRDMPGDSLLATRRALHEAIAEERFEDAAELHDQLKRLCEEDTGV